MRLLKLNLVKFGMFTERELDLLAEGVNVIIGANEAGKTTTMAAVRQLFYGIPLRSPYSYLHSNSDLRIGAIVRPNDGSDFEVYRIKRNTQSLRSGSDLPISEATMAEVLGGVGAEVYDSLFSIGHEEIVSGGQSLLKNEGELGRALFAASTGLTQLNSVMAKLDAKAGELFKSGASKPRINAALTSYKESTSAVKAHSQSSSAVEELDKSLHIANERLSKLELSYRELSGALVRATRVLSSRGQIGRRAQLLQEFSGIDLGNVRVTPNMQSLLNESLEIRRECLASLATLVPDLEKLDMRLAEIDVDEPLLSRSEEIEHLSEQLGGIRQNLKDLPSLNKQVGDLERELEVLFRRVPKNCRRDDKAMPVISDVERSQIQRLGEAWPKIDDALVGARLSRDEIKVTLSRNMDDRDLLPEASDISNLRVALARIREAGQLELSLEGYRQQIIGLETKINSSIASLGLTISPRECDKLSLPSLARVNDVAQHVMQANAALAEALGEGRRIDAELAKIKDDLEGLIQRKDPPSIEELSLARAHRDEGWALVRQVWLEGEAIESQAQAQAQAQVWSDGQSLDRAYEAAVSGADKIADRGWHEARDVEKRANLERQSALDLALIEENARLIEVRRGECEVAGREWAMLWEPLGVVASSRAEMDEFLEAARELGSQSLTLRDLDAKEGEVSATILRCVNDLRGLLGEVGDIPQDTLSLVALLERAEQHCLRSETLDRQRLLVDQEIKGNRSLMEKHERAVVVAESNLALWEVEWSEAIAPLGVDGTTKPQDVSSLLSTLKMIEDKQSELDEKRRRVFGMERRNSQVEEQLKAVLSFLSHLTIDATSTEMRINALQKLLKIQQNADATRRALGEQRDSKVLEVERISRSKADANAKIDALIKEAFVPDEQSLIAAIESKKRSETLILEIEKIETDLYGASGVSLDVLLGEVDSLAGSDLDALIKELSGELDDCDQERKEVAVVIGGLNVKRASIDDSDEAALDAERTQFILADIENNCDEYVRVMVARYLLEQQIVEYRSQNQGPILRRASEIFSQLTLREYSGIDTDVDEKGNLVILATATSGGSLDVGALSVGARDQLYLSLRLAGLEHYAFGTRNLPLLLDDLFVHFDDARTSAGLAVLAQLSSRMQVLLFTHHERVAEQAMDVIPTDKLRVQVLKH
ncbi:unnamed protein product [Acidithrix sp. C25]|nr:unnamed protein product [Acidithrix sp. C25]